MTKYQNLVELVKSKGWKNISRFFRDVKINGNTAQAMRNGEFNSATMQKIADAFDYSVEELEEALSYQAKPVTFAAVKEELEKQEPKGREVTISKEGITDDDTLESMIDNAVKEVEDELAGSEPLTVEKTDRNDPAQNYLEEIKDAADMELRAQWERWVAAHKAEMVRNVVDADMVDTWKVYRSDAPESEKLKALADHVIACGARLQLAKEELGNG